MKKVFVASSREALDKALNVTHILEQIENVEVNCWLDFPGFRPGDYTLEALEKAGREHSAGVFIFDRDDQLMTAKDGCMYLPRDNVLMELGLFCGNSGRRSIAICLVPGVHIPSDLLGITRIAYDVENVKKMKEKLQEWLCEVDDFYNLPQNNLYMGPRKHIHDQCALDYRLHLSDGGYKHIRNIRLMNLACNLFLNPEIADIRDLEIDGSSLLAQSLSKIMCETNARLELMLIEPSNHNIFDVKTKIANHRAGGSAGTVFSAINAVYSMLSSDTIYSRLNRTRFEFFVSRISLPFGIFNVEFLPEYAQFNHVKVDLYSAALDSEDDRRSFIIWQRTDPINYQFFVGNFNRMKSDRNICKEPTVKEIKKWIEYWERTKL
jgi:hypothetical protein